MTNKELRKRNKWKKNLSRRLVEEIISFPTENVEFEIKKPDYVKCTIKTKDAVGVGISICSFIDEPVFDEKRGRNIAAGRAVKALKNMECSEPIRRWTYDCFPMTWFIRQAEKVSSLGDMFWYKSIVESIH